MIPDNAPQWLKDADTKDADVVIELRFGVEVVIWRGGYFLGGEFRGGEFRGGCFRGGYFLGGEFLGGCFLGGEFRGEKITKPPMILLGLTWKVLITMEQVQIGCEVHKAVDWWGFDDNQIDKMESRALAFWKKNKDFIKLMWEKHCAE